jgi:hypothetical protein
MILDTGSDAHVYKDEALLMFKMTVALTKKGITFQMDYTQWTDSTQF